MLREMDGEFLGSYPLPDRVRFRSCQDDANGRLSFDWGFALLLLPVFPSARRLQCSARQPAGAVVNLQAQPEKQVDVTVSAPPESIHTLQAPTALGSPVKS
jgi:hypothetical protein